MTGIVVYAYCDRTTIINVVGVFSIEVSVVIFVRLLVSTSIDI